MDWIDRQQEREERFRNVRAGQNPEPATSERPQKVVHEVTVIGVIKGIDGWYRCGFDEATKTIIPLEFIGKD